jgi:hypothetical protein
MNDVPYPALTSVVVLSCIVVTSHKYALQLQRWRQYVPPQNYGNNVEVHRALLPRKSTTSSQV